MWEYVVINSGEEYLAHSAKGSTWSKHKYIKKENGRYYYADEKGNKTGSVNNSLTATNDGPGYELDDGDKEYMENHKAGKDDRTYEEYMADKQAAIKAADEADKKPAEKEVLTDEEWKKKNRKDDSQIVIAAGRAFVNRYL